jgi:tetratricopeptide (TPR) repeat protein
MMVHSMAYACFWTLVAVPFTNGFTSSSSILRRDFFTLKRDNISACQATKPRVVQNSMVDLNDQSLPPDNKPITEQQGLLLDFVTMVERTPLGELQEDEVELLREVMSALPNEVGGSEGAEMVQGLLYRLFGEWQAGVTADDVERTEHWEPSKTDFSAAITAWEKADLRESATNILALVSDQREFYQNGLVTVKPDLETMQSAFRALESSKERGTESLVAELFESLSDYDVVPDQVIYSSLISIVAKSRQRGAAARAENWLRQAVELYPPNMSKDGVLSGIGVRTFNVVITSWAKSNDKDGPTRAEQLISYMDAMDQKHGSLGVCSPNAKTFTSLIDAYAQQNDWEGVNQAEMILNRLLDQYLDGNDDLEPNVATWTIVISAWSRLSRSNYKGAAGKAERLLQRMESLHAGGRISFRPDAISYVSCMNALAFSNREDGIARAEELLDELNDRFLDGDDTMKPTARSIKVIIDSWIKIDNMKRAEDVLDRYEAMLEADEDPKTAEELQDIYRSMLFGWTKCKDPVSAQDYLDHMVEQGMKPDSFCFDR